MASPVVDVLTTPTKVALTVGSQTPDPDRAIRIAQAVNYPNRAWFCIACFIAFVSLCHWVSVLLKVCRKAPTPGVVRDRGAISIRRLPAAAVNGFRALAFRQTLPIGTSYTLNVAEVFVTAIYITLIFTWTLVNSNSKKGVRYDPKYWANIAGNVASSQLPLMTALGMKNNVISFLTGISFDKLNYLHRMTARVLCVLMWLHGAGRMKLGMTGKVGWANPWVQCGILASTSLTVLSIVSVRPIRNRNYETFLIIHLILSFIVLAAYFHAQGLELGKYVWPSFLIWGFDRLLRAGRLVIFNFGYFKLKRSKGLDAQVDVLSPHFLRITLQRPSHVHWTPGQSAYLTFPSVSAFEAHPFTISTIDTPHTADERDSADLEKESDPQSSSTSSQEQEFGSKRLVFLVRVRSGFTERLLHAARDNEMMRVLLDGPYSSPPLLRGFETVVLIAGGSGVAFTLPLLLDLIHRASKGVSVCQRIVFVWAIRDVRHLEWISDSLIAAVKSCPASIALEVKVFVTATVQEAQSWDDDSSEGDAEVKVDGNGQPNPQLLMSPAVCVQQGRPDVQCLVENELRRGGGPISFNVCGTPALASAVRHALRAPRFLDVLKGGPSVTLHVEGFGNV